MAKILKENICLNISFYWDVKCSKAVAFFRCQKHPPELFFKKVVLKNVAKFKANTYVRVSFLIKLQASACNFIKNKTLALWCFPVNFEMFLATSLSYRPFSVAASALFTTKSFLKLH